ncbi:4130_t:CDS:2 [Paraglomus occultum]|uniref:Phosphatidate cytidylyltransferase n=1 Tax=Paraglomus occultum TaxID=144539 RepID=A0A9N9G7S7_9GLOM|nr:4130_t:CDS:2 [Paraglomus occultum]
MPRRKSDSKANEASKASKTDGTSKSEPVNLLANQSSKWKNMTVRAFWTFVMIFGFLSMVALGHLFVILTVLLLQTLVFKEVIALASVPNKDRKLPWSRTLNWLLLPASLVVCNDSFAYLCGFFWGKTPLIRLSPKKTWEGFIGGWICTMIFAVLWTWVLIQWDYMICPVKDLGASAFSGVHCEPNPVFIPQKHNLNPWLSSILRRLTSTDIRHVWIAPIQWHVLVMACFASLIAPFGGFFASGVKRAFGVKDFGDSIPGHGGFTDRMDCQFLMGLFSYMYYHSFIKTYTYVYIHLSVGGILEKIADSLKPQEQIELFNNLQQYLFEQGLLAQQTVVNHPTS